MSGMLFFLTAMSGTTCPMPSIRDITGTPWTATDSSAYSRAIEGCKEKFPESPCLKTFIKKEKGSYYAICSSAPSKISPPRSGSNNWLYIHAYTLPVGKGGSVGNAACTSKVCNGPAAGEFTITAGGK